MKFLLAKASLVDDEWMEGSRSLFEGKMCFKFVVVKRFPKREVGLTLKKETMNS